MWSGREERAYIYIDAFNPKNRDATSSQPHLLHHFLVALLHALFPASLAWRITRRTNIHQQCLLSLTSTRCAPCSFSKCPLEQQPGSYKMHLQVFSGDDNQILERGDSHSSTSLLDSPCCRPLLSSSAARQVPLRPLDDDDDEELGCAEALVRSFHSYGQSKSGILSPPDNGPNAMARVGSAPCHIGTAQPQPTDIAFSQFCAADWSWVAPNRRRSSVGSAFLRATPPPMLPLDKGGIESASSTSLEECKPIGLDDFELLHVIGQVRLLARHASRSLL